MNPSWPPVLQGIVAVAALMSLSAYGIDIQPLLAFGSISTGGHSAAALWK